MPRTRHIIKAYQVTSGRNSAGLIDRVSMFIFLGTFDVKCFSEL